MTIQVGGVDATVEQKNQIVDDLGAIRDVAGMTTAFNAGSTAEQTAFKTALTIGAGATTGGSPVFVSPTAPTHAGSYMWIQTGLGAGGADMTIWIQD